MLPWLCEHAVLSAVPLSSCPYFLCNNLNLITVLEKYFFLSAWTFLLSDFIESLGYSVLGDGGEVPICLLWIVVFLLPVASCHPKTRASFFLKTICISELSRACTALL